MSLAVHPRELSLELEHLGPKEIKEYVGVDHFQEELLFQVAVAPARGERRYALGPP